jgi:hypothetical protein
VFLFDTREGIADNIAAREGEEQPRRAQISWTYSGFRAERDTHRRAGDPGASV